MFKIGQCHDVVDAYGQLPVGLAGRVEEAAMSSK